MRIPSGLLFSTLLLAGCATQAAEGSKPETFPLGIKNLLPPELVVKLPTAAIEVIDPALLEKNLQTTEPQAKELVVHVGAAEKEPRPQPIAFPHNTHVQKLGMDCQYCHSSARKGIHAGVPSTQLCMGCHEVVPKDGRPELAKLAEYWEKGESIPWNKVHDAPDFVHFNHKPHVRAGVECSECHGQVSEMGVAQRVSTLQMGWCLDCHAQHPSIDTNYGDKAELRRAELKDCYTCHK